MKGVRAVWLALLLAAALLGLLHAARRTSALTHAASQSPIGMASLSAAASVHVSSVAHPSINLSEGRDLLTAYGGGTAHEQAIQQGAARPRALASADFDEDGVADLVCSYADGGSGIIALHRRAEPSPAT